MAIPEASRIEVVPIHAGAQPVSDADAPAHPVQAVADQEKLEVERTQPAVEPSKEDEGASSEAIAEVAEAAAAERKQFGERQAEENAERAEQPPVIERVGRGGKRA